MVNHLVVPAKLWILVLDGVEAVRAGRDDRAVYRCYTHYTCYTRYTCSTGARSMPVVVMLLLAHIEAVAVEHLDILLGHHLPQVFVADRAGSPVHDTSGPRMAKLTCAAFKILATAVATFWLRRSKEPMQPTQ